MIMHVNIKKKQSFKKVERRLFIMGNMQIALLELLSAGGLGAALIITGVVLQYSKKTNSEKCTHLTTGHIVKHILNSNGNIKPVVEYQVNGKIYTVVRRFRGIITRTNVSLNNLYVTKGAYVTDKDYLYVPIGTITNMKQMAQDLWPIGSEMTVYYNPSFPEQAYAEKKPFGTSLLVILFYILGIVILLISVIIAVIIFVS